MAISWRKLGAFVADTQAVDENQLRKFKECGGQWVVPVTYGDESTGPMNIEKLPQFKAKCQAAGLYCGLWFNGWGGDIGAMCAPVAALAKQYALQPVVADLEGEWFKNANAHRFPEVLKELRRLMPDRPIGASTTGFCDRAMIWNGRTLNPPQSLEDLKIKWLPQWYYGYDGKYAADWSMKDLKDNGKTDGNIADPTAYGGRGIRMFNTHGTLYVTGIENHSLEIGLAQIRAARAHGFTVGFSIYLLERTIDSDFALLAAERGEAVRVTVDAKPAKRIRDTRLVANFSVRASSCAVCGAGRPLSAHHVLPRGRGGDDVVANLVALCGSGTTGCHGDVEEYRGDARKRLGLHLAERRPDTLEYLSAKLGGTTALVEFLKVSYGG